MEEFTASTNSTTSTSTLTSSVGTHVSITDIEELFTHFSKNTYTLHDDNPTADEIMQKCIALFHIDYDVTTIDNKNPDADLCYQYPKDLVILEQELNQNTIFENENRVTDDTKLLRLIKKARVARCRTRFPIPVILYKGKYICRSATIAGMAEIYGREGWELICNRNIVNSDDEEEQDKELVKLIEKNPGEETEKDSDSENEKEDTTPTTEESSYYYQMMNVESLLDRKRNADITLLKALNVQTIVDLMVEKKKMKYGFPVTSSEKVDKLKRYDQFSLISLPYPGCEFFNDYRNKNYQSDGLMFDWTQSYVDAEMSIAAGDEIAPQLNIPWANYKTWDLTVLTQNYMKLLLRQIQDSTSGMLVHCISGWDRTPLFISLLRLSLWADGLIHQSLDVQQILYLTVAYDWMLFGHHLSDRLAKGEDIFFFCFNFLKMLADEEFSLHSSRSRRLEKEREREKNWANDMLKEEEVQRVCDYMSSIMSTPPKANLNASSGDEGANATAKSPSSKRTSPISMPRPNSRQRNESISSTSSWAMVSSAGSIREGDGDSNGLNANYDEQLTMPCDIDMIDSRFRYHRLQRVRKIFLKSYYLSIGPMFNNNPTLYQTLATFAHKTVADVSEKVVSLTQRL